jgi:hypothetical protein
MPRTLKRTAAFTALGRALFAGTRGGPSLPKRVAAIPRMMKATATGEYDGGVRMAMMVGAVAYIASPVDLVPEAFLLVLGLADDVLMATWVAGAILSETERFLAWEARRDPVIPGTVVS